MCDKSRLCRDESTKRTEQMRIDELSSSNLLVPWILLRPKNLVHVSDPFERKIPRQESKDIKPVTTRISSTPLALMASALSKKLGMCFKLNSFPHTTAVC